MEQIANPIDSLLPVIATAIAQWKEQHTEEQIRKEVHTLLNKEAKQVVLKMLGFDNDWGEWKIDHCNGRFGESAVGDYLRKTQEAVIHEWMSTVAMPKLSPALKAKLQAQAQKEYEEFMRRRISAQVQQMVNNDLDELLKSLTRSNRVEAYGKALQLIQSKENNAS